MKLYTEEQVREAYFIGYQDGVDGSNKHQLKVYKSIELPTDKDIHNSSPYHDGTEYSIGEHHGFKKGAKWMRDKIKGGNK